MWERYQEALNIFTALQDPRNIADVLNDMGILFRNVGAYDAAKDALIQSAKAPTRRRVWNATRKTCPICSPSARRTSSRPN